MCGFHDKHIIDQQNCVHEYFSMGKHCQNLGCRSIPTALGSFCVLSLKVRKGLLVLSYDFDDCKEWVMCSGIKNMPFFLAGIHPKRVAHGLIVVILKLSMLNNMA